MTTTTNEKPPAIPEVHHPNPSKVEYYIELIFDKFSKGIRLVGPLFAFALTVFISIVTHAFFHVILPYYTRQYGFFFGVLLVFMALFTLFNLLFNYFMAVLVKPGSMTDIKNSRYFKKHDTMKVNPDIIDFNTVFNNSANKIGKPYQKQNVEKNVFEFKANKNSTINNEDTLLSMNKPGIENNLFPNDSKANEITEDSIDELTKNLDDKIGCVPKINENDLLSNSFNDTEINLLNLNNNINNNNLLAEDVKPYENSGTITVNGNDEVKHEDEKNTVVKNGNIYTTDKSASVTTITFASSINKCKYCKELKVLRSHHCQVCGICVFKMDHHCPWINNCVGHYNHRYFVLFLTWLMLGCLYVSIFSVPLLFMSSTRLKKSNEFNFVSVLCLVGMLLMTFFNTWNWFLVMRGNTTIEFWTLKSGFKTDFRIKDFSLPIWRDNVFLVFGTRSIWQAICCASRRRLPVSGLEWTRLAIPEFVLDSQYYMDDNNIEEKTNMIVNSNV